MPHTSTILSPASDFFAKVVLQNVSDIVITTDLDFVVQSWNGVAEEFYGIPATAAIGKKMGSLVQFRFFGTSAAQAITELHTHKIWRGEVSFTNARGEVFYFLQTVKFIINEAGVEVGVLATGRNVSQQKGTEETLQKSELFYRGMIAHSLDLMLLVAADGTISFCTPSLKNLLGYEPEELIGTNAFQHVHPDDLPLAQASFKREVEESPEIKFILVRLLKKDGKPLWCNVRGHNLLSVPAVASVVLYIHDETPRRNATEALKESEQRFRTLIRDLQIGVLLQNAEGLITMTNHAMCRLFDVTEQEILGGKIWELFTDVIHEDGALFVQSERPSFKAFQTRQLVKDVVMGVWHPARGERIWIMISADPIVDEHENLVHIVCSFTDITERKKLEQKSLQQQVAYQRQLAQATIDGQEKERLEIGKDLHDNIGQQLTTVKLLLDLAKSSATSETADLISTAIRSVSGVIDEIRTMSRALVPHTLKDLGFIDSVNELIRSLHHTRMVAVKFDYAGFNEEALPENKQLGLYRIIQEQLNNIIKHSSASDAHIMLRCTLDEVTLQITDNGMGFEPDKVKKGLGLKNITNRAEFFGGRAEITTAPGEGCGVKIFLPHLHEPVVCG